MQFLQKKPVLFLLIGVLFIILVEIILLGLSFSKKTTDNLQDKPIDISIESEIPTVSLKLKDKTLLQKEVSALGITYGKKIPVWNTDESKQIHKLVLKLTDKAQRVERSYDENHQLLFSLGEEVTNNDFIIYIHFSPQLTEQKSFETLLNRGAARALMGVAYPDFFVGSENTKNLTPKFNTFKKNIGSFILVEKKISLLNIFADKMLSLVVKPVSAACSGTYACANMETNYDCQGDSPDSDCVGADDGDICGNNASGTCKVTQDCSGSDVEKFCSAFAQQDTCTNDRGQCSQAQCLSWKACEWAGPPPPTSTPRPPTSTVPPGQPTSTPAPTVGPTSCPNCCPGNPASCDNSDDCCAGGECIIPGGQTTGTCGTIVGCGPPNRSVCQAGKCVDICSGTCGHGGQPACKDQCSYDIDCNPTDAPTPTPTPVVCGAITQNGCSFSSTGNMTTADPNDTVYFRVNYSGGGTLSSFSSTGDCDPPAGHARDGYPGCGVGYAPNGQPGCTAKINTNNYSSRFCRITANFTTGDSCIYQMCMVSPTMTPTRTPTPTPAYAAIKGSFFAETNNNTEKNNADSFLVGQELELKRSSNDTIARTTTTINTKPNFSFNNLLNNTYYVDIPTLPDYVLMKCNDVVNPSNIQVGSYFYCFNNAQTSARLKRWGATGFYQDVDNYLGLDGANITVNIPMVTPTPTNTPAPTATPAQQPWVKMKNASYQTTPDGLSNTTPSNPIQFDSDDVGGASGAYLVIDKNGTVTGDIVPTPALPATSRWFSSSYSPSTVFNSGNFIEYVKSRKPYTTITSVDQINASGTYFRDDNITLDNLPALPSGSTILLLVNGDVSFNTSILKFNADAGNPSRPTRTIAIVANNITFHDTMTDANGIFIAQEQIRAGTTPNTNRGLKIYGNIMSGEAIVNNRVQPDNREPSIFIVNDISGYLKLIPYLSISTYDWKQLQ